MENFDFNNRGQSLIGVIVVLVIVGAITSGFYYYLQKQAPEVSKVTEMPAEKGGITEEGEVILPTEEKVTEKIVPSKEEISHEEVELEITCQNECSPIYSKQCVAEKGLWVCGYYDEDDCLEWSSMAACPLNTICQNGNCIQQKCTDGTLYDQCSVNKPKYCENGNLVDRCSICSCATNKSCQIDESCVVIKKNDCENKNYKMAFILLENSNNPATQDDVETINKLKQETSDRFSWATQGLASMDTSYPVIILRLENNPTQEEITKEFYKNNSDDFHFITIFNTYDNNGNQHHVLVRNHISGIGLNIYDRSLEYGSEGRLLGINWMKDVDMYKPGMFSWETKLVTAVNGILHETSHQWGVFIDFIDEDGQESNILRNPYNMVHWDKKLETGYDLLNGFSWIDNGDGTFIVKTRTDWRNNYSDLDLYLMGLLSKNEIDPLKLIVSDYDTKDIQTGTTISGTIKTISIQQIIEAEGERACLP